MPIWLRNYTFQKIQDYFDSKQKAEKEAYDKARGVEKLSTLRPDIKPSYTTKASK